MGHNGKEEVMVSEIETTNAMVEIKIKTLDSQTYTLQVDKCVSVPALKEQVASVTGIVTEQQRLICRGKVLKDDQLLSAYHVEDGHTLHLVERQQQPVPPVTESSTSNAADGAGDGQGGQRSRVVVGSFNIAEQGDYSDLGQIVSAVLGSLGISSAEGGIEATGSLQERLSQAFGQSVGVDQTSTTPMTSSQPPQAVPDSLTTLSEYLNHLRQEFSVNGSNTVNTQDTEAPAGSVQDSGSTTTGETRVPRPSHLVEVLRSTRQLLTGEAADCLSNLSSQLEDHVNVTDPSTRSLRQANILQAGSLLENLGISLLELGRATMMLRLGQTPDDAVVNAGPAVFISPTGRNPLPSSQSRLGASLAGQSLASTPRNIEIRIRTGTWMPSTEAEEATTQQQTPAQTVPSAPATDSVPSSRRGQSETTRTPVSLLIPIVTRYQVSTSTGLGGVAADSTVQPQSNATSQGDSGGSVGRGLADIRNRINQFLRPLSRREDQSATTASMETVANPPQVVEQVAASGTTTDEGNFISSILQQIMPLISQNVQSSTSDEAATGNGTQAPSREEQEGVERGESSRRREPPSPPDSKRQKRE